jgi:hypothetical protein
VPFTAFTSRRQSEHISARLIVRRVRRLNPKTVADGQGELFAGYRHHGVFTDSPLTMLDAEKSHRAHAIVEQVIADLKASALAQLPSGSFAANSAWLVLAAIAFNLTRAAANTWSVDRGSDPLNVEVLKDEIRLSRGHVRITAEIHHDKLPKLRGVLDPHMDKEVRTSRDKEDIPHLGHFCQIPRE